MPPLHRLALVSLLSLILVACGGRLTSANLAKVKSGMSQAEVEALLGQPLRKENSTFLGLHGTAWFYELGSSKVVISFVNDRMVSRDGALPP